MAAMALNLVSICQRIGFVPKWVKKGTHWPDPRIFQDIKCIGMNSRHISWNLAFSASSSASLALTTRLSNIDLRWSEGISLKMLSSFSSPWNLWPCQAPKGFRIRWGQQKHHKKLKPTCDIKKDSGFDCRDKSFSSLLVHETTPAGAK